MSILVWSCVWSVVAYMIVKKYKEKYPNLDADEKLYAICSFFVGALWCMLYFAYKIYRHKNYGDFSK